MSKNPEIQVVHEKPATYYAPEGVIIVDTDKRTYRHPTAEELEPGAIVRLNQHEQIVWREDNAGGWFVDEPTHPNP